MSNLTLNMRDWGKLTLTEVFATVTILNLFFLYLFVYSPNTLASGETFDIDCQAITLALPFDRVFLCLGVIL